MHTLEPLHEELRQHLDSADTAAKIGRIHSSGGQHAEALIYFERARSYEPESAHRWASCAETLFKMRRLDAARDAYDRVVTLDPHNVERRYRYASLLFQAEAFPDRAEELQTSAIILRPDIGDRDLLLTRHLLTYLAPDAAVARLESLLSSHIDSPRLRAWVGESLYELGRYGDAKIWMERCVAEQPARADLIVALGSIEASLGNHERADELFWQALRVESSDIRVLRPLVWSQFRAGDLDAARRTFRDWAARHGESMIPMNVAPPWRGEPVAGKTLLLAGEFGYGDAIQLVRFGRDLTEAGATVVLECDRALARLAGTIDGISRIVLKREEPGQIDYQLGDYLQSLLIDWTWESVGRCVPYLHVPPAAQAPWQAADEPRTCRVGLNWQGTQMFLNNPYMYRSMALETLAPLAAVPGVTLCSLQFGSAGEQVKQVSFPVRELAPRLDFFDEAAAASAMDVVVTIDSAMAHVAGGLGKPCLMLLPYFASAQWMAHREDSPWYPSLRMFRQTTPGDWTTPVRAAAEAIAALAAARR